MNIGGAGKHLCYLISASDRTKFDYTVILPEGSAAAPMIGEAGAKIEFVGRLDRSFRPSLTGKLARVLRRLKPDIVHTHSSVTGRIAARRAGVKTVVMTKHSSDLPVRALRMFPLKTLARLHFALTLDAAIATDDSAALSMIKGGVPEKKITVIYNGVNPLKKATDEETDRLRADIGIPPHGKVVGFFGRLEKEKGADDFLRTAALCAAQTPSVFFIVVGDGSLRSSLEILAGRFGLSGRVFFCGFREDIAPYMSLCSIVVNSSTGVETSNQVLSEGMSLGLIPVVTDTGGSRRMAEGCGVTVPAGDPPAMADAILTLLRSPSQMKYSSAAAAEKYAEKYTAGRMAAQTEELYRTLLRRKVNR